MSRPAATLGDLCTGHRCFPPRPIISASPTLFVNGRPVARQGDSLMIHCCPKKGCHPGTISSGSSTIFVDGRPVARIGDRVSCGSRIAQGSGNVFLG